MLDLDRHLRRCLQSTHSDDLQTLIAHERNTIESYGAFGIATQAMDDAIAARLHLLREVYPDLNQFCQQTLGWTRCPLTTAWTLWLPLAQWISKNQRNLSRPITQGILGGQGTGKTTLTTILSRILTQLGHKVCCLSIDDVYLAFHERQQLQHQDPRLIWRGPPGTHDVALAISTLEQLASGHSAVIPRFDKSAYGGQGDRSVGETVTGVTIILFEGWFVGMRPIAPERLAPDQLAAMPWPIETEADLAFARDSNARLWAYVPLWEKLNHLVVLHPVDYRLSQQWRREAELAMTATGRSGMSDRDIDRFVLYFWQSLHPDLFLTPLLKQDDVKPDAGDQRVDLVVEIDAYHRPYRIYRP
ncbi:MAG: hypothetical protein WBA10_21765 [Elainellaceae cyanobacterium]